MLLFNTAAGQTAGLVSGTIALIFGLGAVKRYCGGSKKSDIVAWVLLILSIGLVMFFLLYGGTKDPATALKFKIYGMILSSFLVILSITSIMLKRKSIKQDKVSKQRQEIHCLKTKLANLEIKLSILSRSIDWAFNDLYPNTKVSVNVEEKNLISCNKKFCDFYICCKIVKLIILSMALLVFLYQSFDGPINESPGFSDLFMYCTLVSLFLVVFVVDQLMVYCSKTEYGLIKKENNKVISSLSGELKVKQVKHDTLSNLLDEYNIMCDNAYRYSPDKFKRKQDRILDVLGRM
ncbi:hypothetical protein K6025_03790 [Ehrlichia sp. JZT12]